MADRARYADRDTRGRSCSRDDDPCSAAKLGRAPPVDPRGSARWVPRAPGPPDATHLRPPTLPTPSGDRECRTSVLWWGLAALVAMLRVVDPLLERTVRSALPVREVLEVLMTTGTIKKVVADRGFGFIAAEDAKEYFFHRGALDSSLDFDRLVGGERVDVRDRAEPQGSARRQVRAA